MIITQGWFVFSFYDNFCANQMSQRTGRSKYCQILNHQLKVTHIAKPEEPLSNMQAWVIHFEC